MCLSSVYSEQDGKRTLLMSKAAGLESDPDGIICRDFLGRTIRISGKISSIDLENNIIVCKLEDK